MLTFATLFVLTAAPLNIDESDLSEQRPVMEQEDVIEDGELVFDDDETVIELIEDQE